MCIAESVRPITFFFFFLKDQLEHLYRTGPNVPPERYNTFQTWIFHWPCCKMNDEMIFFHLRVSQLLSFATTLCSQESASLSLPDFPVDNLPSALTVLVSSKSHEVLYITVNGEV